MVLIPGKGKRPSYASERAIPAWMKVKDAIVETQFEARRILAKYRYNENPAYLHKLKNKIIILYDLIREDYVRDDKLRDAYPRLVDIDACLYKINNAKTDEWWIRRYNDVNGVIYSLGITKITRYEDSDDDFDGVEDMME